MTAVACLQPGAYDLVAEDGGDLNRGWGFGTSVNVVEVVVDAKDKSMREKAIADVDAPTWFTSGRRKALTFDVDASAGVVEAAARARIQHPIRNPLRKHLRKKRSSRSKRTIPSSRMTGTARRRTS